MAGASGGARSSAGGGSGAPGAGSDGDRAAAPEPVSLRPAHGRRARVGAAPLAGGTVSPAARPAGDRPGGADLAGAADPIPVAPARRRGPDAERAVRSGRDRRRRVPEAPRDPRLTSMPRILVVDDEPEIVDLLRSYLQRDGFDVDQAADGEAALAVFGRLQPDLVILDLMLPKLNGREVCRRIRETARTPIIMLTARDEESDKLIGLELGADDYTAKPFSPREVLARVRAVLRRGSREMPEMVRAGDLMIDLRAHEVSLQGRRVDLTPTEFRLLEILAGHPNQVFTRMQLIDRVQGHAFEGYERTVDAHIKNLRGKVEPDPKNPRYVLTVYGVGYKFQTAENHDA